jgi:hypothetical protein
MIGGPASRWPGLAAEISSRSHRFRRDLARSGKCSGGLPVSKPRCRQGREMTSDDVRPELLGLSESSLGFRILITSGHHRKPLRSRAARRAVMPWNV